MADAVRIHFDTKEWDAFTKGTPALLARMRRRFLESGSQIVRSFIVLEAARRVGVETAESHMQSVDPGRPKGFYAASVRTDVAAAEAEIHPVVPYSWWVEGGSAAPSGVPATHKHSQFTGHLPVERGAKDSEEPLGVLLEDIAMDTFRGL